ncbi:MAG: zinc ribbon domain-containing protein [Nitrospirae bacterium]|nr:MAG: zinc ribbon domain-containing protein [Nitrospirota bacterium]
MPIYEYVCQGCEHRFEIKQKMSDPPVTGCPRCGQPVTKVISAPAIMFKGTGWYVTDYSDKMKPPGQSESAGKPSNGQSEQKKDAMTTPAAPAAGASESAPAAPSSSSGTGGTSSSAPSSQPAGTSSSSTPTSSASKTP